MDIPRSVSTLLALGLLSGCTSLTEPAKKENYERPEPKPVASAAPQEPEKQEEEAKVEVKDVKVGSGKEAKEGDTIAVLYRGTLLDGTEFDSSAAHAAPDGSMEAFEFTLGRSQVIKGWDQGVPGMKEGGTRELTIPASLAYGDRAAGKIPPNSALKFTVDLIKIKDGPGQPKVTVPAPKGAKKPAAKPNQP